MFQDDPSQAVTNEHESALLSLCKVVSLMLGAVLDASGVYLVISSEIL